MQTGHSFAKKIGFRGLSLKPSTGCRGPDGVDYVSVLDRGRQG